MTQNSDDLGPPTLSAMAITNSAGRVVARGYDANSGDEVFELELDPDQAREMAYQLTKNSLEAEAR